MRRSLFQERVGKNWRPIRTNGIAMPAPPSWKASQAWQQKLIGDEFGLVEFGHQKGAYIPPQARVS